MRESIMCRIVLKAYDGNREVLEWEEQVVGEKSSVKRAFEEKVEPGVIDQYIRGRLASLEESFREAGFELVKGSEICGNVELTGRSAEKLEQVFAGLVF